MAGAVLFEKSDRFDCRKCMSGEVWKAQGRDDAYIAKRVTDRMKSKGCTSETVKPVLRLADGDSIHRCPRALADDFDTLHHFNEFSLMRDGLFTFAPKSGSWKWHKVINMVRLEYSNDQKRRHDDLRAQQNAIRNQQAAKGRR